MMNITSGSPAFYPTYSFVFPFEKNFNSAPYLKFVSENFYLAHYTIALYLAFVYYGPIFMKSRTALELKPVLFIWNTLLAIYSIMSALRFTPEFVYGFSNFGLKHTICNNAHYLFDIGAFWSVLFTFSKFVELGDTVFLILRKRNVMFLHWYHHITVLLYCWTWYPFQTGPSRWYAILNSYIHAFMYFYYAMSAINVRLPRVMAVMITSGQIFQMILGLFVTSFACYNVLQHKKCDVPYHAVTTGMAMYLSYFVLFVIYFRNNYLRKSKKLA